MPVSVLNVAEKPSVAKEVSRILSNGAARSSRGRCAPALCHAPMLAPMLLACEQLLLPAPSAASAGAPPAAKFPINDLLLLRRSQYNPIWRFGATIGSTPCDMVFTSVAGHLMQLEFGGGLKRWSACSPLELYTAPVVKDVPSVWLPACSLQWLATHSLAAVCLSAFSCSSACASIAGRQTDRQTNRQIDICTLP
jgi:DNA topoisomerase III